MIKLSLCMIVKNEETVLERCLESAAGKNNRQENPTDEIIIADTGSTDGTKNIAEAYGAKIYDFPGKTIFRRRGISRFPKRRAIIFYGWTPTITFRTRRGRNCLR